MSVTEDEECGVSIGDGETDSAGSILSSRRAGLLLPRCWYIDFLVFLLANDCPIASPGLCFAYFFCFLEYSLETAIAFLLLDVLYFGFFTLLVVCLDPCDGVAEYYYDGEFELNSFRDIFSLSCDDAYDNSDCADAVADFFSLEDKLDCRDLWFFDGL